MHNEKIIRRSRSQQLACQISRRPSHLERRLTLIQNYLSTTWNTYSYLIKGKQTSCPLCREQELTIRLNLYKRIGGTQRCLRDPYIAYPRKNSQSYRRLSQNYQIRDLSKLAIPQQQPQCCLYRSQVGDSTSVLTTRC